MTLMTLGAMWATHKIAQRSNSAIGVPASVAHIYTNPNLDKRAKKEVVLKSNMENLKDTAITLGVAGGAAGVAAGITAGSKKAAGLANKAVSYVGNQLAKVAYNGKDLKSLIKNSKIGAKLNSLPTPAKAAIAVGAGILAAAAPLLLMVTGQKTGYIEGKNENPNVYFDV